MSFLQDANDFGVEVESTAPAPVFERHYSPWVAISIAAGTAALFVALAMPANSRGKAAELGMSEEEYDDYLETKQLQRLAMRRRAR